MSSGMLINLLELHKSSRITHSTRTREFVSVLKGQKQHAFTYFFRTNVKPSSGSTLALVTHEKLKKNLNDVLRTS